MSVPPVAIRVTHTFRVINHVEWEVFIREKNGLPVISSAMSMVRRSLNNGTLVAVVWASGLPPPHLIYLLGRAVLLFVLRPPLAVPQLSSVRPEEVTLPLVSLTWRHYLDVNGLL